MRPRQLRRRLSAAAFAAILAGTGIGWGAGIAKADPGADYAADHAAAICITLDAFPSFAGIEGIAQAIVQQGYLSYWDAGRAIGVSVGFVCPEHSALVKAYAATYAPVQKRVV